MKIFEPEELYDHTIRFDFANERAEVEAYLVEHNVVFKNWNGGILIVKKENNNYLLPENHNGMGNFEVYWHKDVQKFIDCEPVRELRKRYATHNDIVKRIVNDLDDLEDLKEGITA